MFGGTQVLINGPCFNSTNLIICDFDGFETSGRLLEDEVALCVSPTFYKVGQITLRVSLDDGLTFDFTGLFTIISVEDVPDGVFSSVTESNQKESDFEITWNTDALESVDEVDVVVYGYREDDYVEFSGPLVIVAQGVDYRVGYHSVSGLLDPQIHFDVGVIGVIESNGQGENSLGGGQECCYGDDGMIINIVDSLGGGFNHRYHHGGVTPYGAPKKVPYMSHYFVDILPWTYCCTYGGPDECTNFARRRPSQTCNNYVPPALALGSGDPHISTLDSTTYTFNGHGEFTLLNALNDIFILQARAAPLVGTSDATVFVAMAVRFGDSDVIHVQTNERRVLDVYVRLAGDGQNFTRIEFDQASRWSYSGVSVTGRNITSDGIIVSFDGGVGLNIKAFEGAMSIFLVAPDSFRGLTQGLMGTWNGNASDDFLTPQGSILSPDLTTEQLHYQFGLLWEIGAAKSVFYYEPGKDHEFHTNRHYIPVFEPVANPSVDQSLVVEVCGTNPFCIFDYQTTGSQSFAQNTVKSLVQYQQAVDNRASFVSCPSLPAPAKGRAIVATYKAGGVARFVCDASFELSHVVNLTCQSNGTWSHGDIPTCMGDASGQTKTTPSRTGTPLVLSRPAIIGIYGGTVIPIGVIVLVVILICRPKKRPPSSRKVNPSTDQAEVQENPKNGHA
ncbi:sushi domain-containing protein 2-like [Strongylocentrotus purpuratus]|uniref:Uncharacterized protein n=1 Tax=Strongylocentrotus purpuratus TaxID=7668 RepID=A0A7M7SVV7_STRPU|nr:sushi domain-containing protein 2-like [Strongylocentrotus purpuratus]